MIAIRDLNNPIAPLILETFQAESLPQGVIAVLGQGISKPEGYFSYNRATQSADLFWPSNSVDSQRNAQGSQIRTVCSIKPMVRLWLARLINSTPGVPLVVQYSALSAITSGKSSVIKTCLSSMVRSFHVRQPAPIPR